MSLLHLISVTLSSGERPDSFKWYSFLILVADFKENGHSISESNSQVINLSKSDSDIIRVNSTYVLAGTDFSTKTNNADADAAAESFRVRFVWSVFSKDIFHFTQSF